MILIRVFKALTEPESCMKFAEGHLQVLQEFDINKISPLNLDWIKDPYSYVIVAEDISTGRIVAGAQLQLGGGKRPLPIESAIREIDDRVHDAIKSYGVETTGELYGLWNSRDIAGMGIGNYYLTLAAIAVAPQLKLQTIFALCSPYTTEFYSKFGFEVTKFLGNNGSFFYPKKDLTAIGMVLLQCDKLDTTGDVEKELIESLRNNHTQVRTVEGRRGQYDIQFQLDVRSVGQKHIF